MFKLLVAICVLAVPVLASGQCCSVASNEAAAPKGPALDSKALHALLTARLNTYKFVPLHPALGKGSPFIAPVAGSVRPAAGRTAQLTGGGGDGCSNIWPTTGVLGRDFFVYTGAALTGDLGWKNFGKDVNGNLPDVKVYPLFFGNGTDAIVPAPYYPFQCDQVTSGAVGTYQWVGPNGNPNPLNLSSGTSFSAWNEMFITGGIGPTQSDSGVTIIWQLNGWGNCAGTPVNPDGSACLYNGEVIVISSCKAQAGTYNFGCWATVTSSDSAPYYRYLRATVTSDGPASSCVGSGNVTSCPMCQCAHEVGNGLLDGIKALLMSLFTPSQDHIDSLKAEADKFDTIIDPNDKQAFKNLSETTPAVPAVVGPGTGDGGLGLVRAVGGGPATNVPGAVGFWIPGNYVAVDQAPNSGLPPVATNGGGLLHFRHFEGNPIWDVIRAGMGGLVYMLTFVMVLKKLWPRFIV